MTVIIVTLAGIGLLTLLCQWLAWQVKLPAILFLLLSGILVGPILGWLHPTIFFGNLLQPIIALSVAIILFEGSLTLRFEETQGIGSVVRNLITIGLLITWIATAIFTHFIFHFPWEVSALLGAITSVTGPTVIAPILRTVRPNSQIANVLRWEGILIDPIGAVLAVLVFGFIQASRGHEALYDILYNFAEMIIVGTTLGIVVAYWLGTAIRRLWLPDFLHNVATLILVLIVFTVSNLIDDGSGLLAVTVMGIWLANMQDVAIEEILGFKESLSILLISGLFIILAAKISFAHILEIIVPALGLLAALQFVVRPLNIIVCTWGSSLNFRERALLAWIAPRGIVAAAVSGLFAYRLQQNHFDGAELLVLLTFIIIIGTVIFQSLTAGFVAKWLGVSEPEAKGFLMIGANPLARMIAKALVANGYRVMLSGRNWSNIHEARMEGLEGYYGNPISEHADRNLDLIGIGRMLAITAQEDLNALACMRYRSEFGRHNVFTIQAITGSKREALTKHAVGARHTGAKLFAKDLTFAKLSSLISQGAKIHSTTLSQNFDFEAYKKQYGKQAIPLFGIGPKGRLHIFTSEQVPAVDADWVIISLVSPQ